MNGVNGMYGENGKHGKDGGGFRRGGRSGGGVRKAVAAAVVVSAALVVTACQPTESSSKPAQSTPAPAGSSPAASPSASAPAAGTPTASSPATPDTPATPTASAPGAPATTGPTDPAASASASAPDAVAACAAKSLEVSAWQASERPVGTGTGAAIVEFVNVSGKACVLKGHPSVAGAGNGSPEHNSPLAVTPTGSASPVKLAPGGKAWTKLTFVQVHGEGDGYCKSGAVPSVYPTVVVGLPGSGSHQVALNDGQFAECDNTVTVTAVSAVKP
ncbi:DUF4232 domain-containing protein [Streptomyces sp. NBC_00199]|uniref:DUF4232 domain-containing protein n=1 Tax=Streptomyces sp. NBC_00199 TaxID=2975678 RepID=UPI002257F7F6|nr:DUF4232 domain-containing protein [Streptomyces sp. NBC_00199]MCX5265110.1 DUF4232 domain-containing protein [Streptomyces sp. NBC_00199]